MTSSRNLSDPVIFLAAALAVHWNSMDEVLMFDFCGEASTLDWHW